MRANTEAAKLLVYQAACAKDNHEKYSHLAAMAKLVSSRNASDVTRRCLQLFAHTKSQRKPRYNCFRSKPYL